MNIPKVPKYRTKEMIVSAESDGDDIIIWVDGGDVVISDEAFNALFEEV